MQLPRPRPLKCPKHTTNKCEVYTIELPNQAQTSTTAASSCRLIQMQGWCSLTLGLFIDLIDYFGVFSHVLVHIDTKASFLNEKMPQT